MAVTPEQTLATLRARSAEARRGSESHAAEVRTRVAQVVSARLAAGASCWLIGSLAWGGFGERSDVDLVVKGLSDADATSIELAVSRAALAPVDMLRWEELPASFRTRVEREGHALHGR